MTQPPTDYATPGDTQSVRLTLPLPMRYFTLATGGVLWVVLLSSATLVVHELADTRITRYIHRFFWVDGEGNFATLANYLLLIASACLLGVMALRQFEARGRFRWHWAGLVAIFTMMAFDEAARMHERLITPVRDMMDLDGALTFAWVVPGAVFVGCIALIYLRFLLHQAPRVALMMVAAGAIYVGGAIGFEMIGAQIYAADGNFQSSGYRIATTLEETGEMIGLCLFGSAILMAIRQEKVRVEQGAGQLSRA